jgi:hypothetical protein
MKDRDSKGGLWPPIDQWLSAWGLFLFVIPFVLASEALGFLARLTGVAWICSLAVGIGVAALGIGLLVYARVQVCRERHEHRRQFYRWGSCCAVVGIVLVACLLMSKQ